MLIYDIFLLHRFFGLVRSFRGDEDHPTVTKFSQLFRLLSLFTPVEVAMTGNWETGLGEKRHEGLIQKKARKERVWQELMAIPLRDLSNALNDHKYSLPSLEETALYYLAGYVAFKVKKKMQCELCKADALGRQDSLPREAMLIIERKYVSACLAYPSKKMFASVSTV